MSKEPKGGRPPRRPRLDGSAPEPFKSMGFERYDIMRGGVWVLKRGFYPQHGWPFLYGSVRRNKFRLEVATRAGAPLTSGYPMSAQKLAAVFTAYLLTGQIEENKNGQVD